MAGPAQPTEWYLARDNKQYGPVGELEIAKLIELSHLREHDLVWRAGFADWLPAATVFPQAFAPAEPAPPPIAEPMPPPGSTSAHAAEIRQTALHAPTQLDPQQAPAPSYEPGPRQHAGMQQHPTEPQQPAMANVETLSDYRARIGGRHEPAATAQQPMPVEAAHATFAQANVSQAASTSGPATPQRRIWIAPADAEPTAAMPRAEARERIAPAFEPIQPRRLDPVLPHPSPAPGAPVARSLDREADALAAAGFGRPSHPQAGRFDPPAYSAPPAPTARREAQMRLPASLSREPAASDFEDEDDQPPRRSGRRLIGLFAILLLLALIGGGTWLALAQSGNFMSLLRSLGVGDGNGKPIQTNVAGKPPSPTATKTAVVADKRTAAAALAAAKVAAPPVAAAPMQSFPETAAAIDQMLQSGRLWQLIKTEFPEWYDERVREVQRLVSEKRPDEAISKHLIDALVSLRRKNADSAFQASLPRLQHIARTFRDSLDVLSRHSQVACYSLISSGEGSRGMVSLFRDPQYGAALQGSLVAVFEAIAEGRKTPATVLPARRGDYDLLTRELTALGWSESDLNLFADSQGLARTSPEQVCRMVREWFTAHIAVPDKDVQTRLLVESVRPVVAG